MKLTWPRAPGGAAANERALREVTSSRAKNPSARLASALALLLLGGCTAIVESEKKQCQRDADCGALLGTDAPYTCQNNYCVGATCDPAFVTSGKGTRVGDATCKELGFPAAVCGANGSCVPGCLSDAECGADQTCVLSKNVCATRECTVVEDCNSSSPTMECLEGLCNDETWGCIGQKDDRPPPTMPTATLRVPFYDALTMLPVLGVTATACPDLAFDSFDCATPLAGTKATQGADGIITVTGLQQGLYFRLKIDPPVPNPNNYSGVDFYSQKRVRDVMTVEPVTTVSRDYLEAAPSGYSPPISIDPSNGGLFTRAFDCLGRPAAGMTLDIEQTYLIPPNMMPGAVNAPTFITYFSNNLPDPSRRERYTDSSGLISALNVSGQLLIPLSTSVFGRSITTTRTRFRPGRITTVHFHPRDYAPR